MRWLELVLEVPPQDADAMAEVLAPYCYGGAVAEPALEGVPGSEDPVLSAERPTLIRCYLPIDQEIDSKLSNLLAAVRAVSQHLAVSQRETAEEDWAEVWKRHFKSRRIGHHIVIKPTWERYRARPGDIVIELDPGMAFGTGDHSTTRACLRALEQYLRPGYKVLDLGTGSGILAIAAARLGASAVLALDTDPLAVRAARENCALNQVAGTVTVQPGSLERTQEQGWQQADLLLANLNSQLHVEMAPDIIGALSAGGIAVASGIGAQALRRVSAAYRRAGAQRIAARRHGEWRTLILRRGPAKA